MTAHARAIASAVTHKGFVAADHPTLATTEAIGQVIKFLTAPQAKAQRAIVNAIYKLVTHPLIVATNDSKLRARMMGAGGLARSLLRVLLDTIWLCTKPRDRRHALPHRTHGAEMQWEHWSLKILNPGCAGKLRKVLGEYWDGAILEAAVNSISELIGDLRDIARRPGWPVPDTTIKILEGVFGRLYRNGTTCDPGFLGSEAAPTELRPTVMMKMCALQFTFWLVAQRTAAELIDTLSFYIFSPNSFAVGMKESELTREHVQCGQGTQGPIRVAHQCTGLCCGALRDGPGCSSL